MKYYNFTHILTDEENIEANVIIRQVQSKYDSGLITIQEKQYGLIRLLDKKFSKQITNEIYTNIGDDFLQK